MLPWKVSSVQLLGLFFYFWMVQYTIFWLRGPYHKSPHSLLLDSFSLLLLLPLCVGVPVGDRSGEFLDFAGHGAVILFKVLSMLKDTVEIFLKNKSWDLKSRVFDDAALLLLTLLNLVLSRNTSPMSVSMFFRLHQTFSAAACRKREWWKYWTLLSNIVRVNHLCILYWNLSLKTLVCRALNSGQIHEKKKNRTTHVGKQYCCCTDSILTHWTTFVPESCNQSWHSFCLNFIIVILVWLTWCFCLRFFSCSNFCCFSSFSVMRASLSVCRLLRL